MEPLTEVCGHNEQLSRATGFDLGFAAHHVKVKLDLSKVQDCLHRVREMYENATPLQPCMGCKDCQGLNQIIELLQPPSPEIFQTS